MAVDPQIQELARRVAERFSPDWFLREVVEQGIVLYERPHP
jgi:hypothetical protein